MAKRLRQWLMKLASSYVHPRFVFDDTLIVYRSDFAQPGHDVLQMFHGSPVWLVAQSSLDTTAAAPSTGSSTTWFPAINAVPQTGLEVPTGLGVPALGVTHPALLPDPAASGVYLLQSRINPLPRVFALRGTFQRFVLTPGAGTAAQDVFLALVSARDSEADDAKVRSRIAATCQIVGGKARLNINTNVNGATLPPKHAFSSSGLFANILAGGTFTLDLYVNQETGRIYSRLWQGSGASQLVVDSVDFQIGTALPPLSAFGAAVAANAGAGNSATVDLLDFTVYANA